MKTYQITTASGKILYIAAKSKKAIIDFFGYCAKIQIRQDIDPLTCFSL